HLAVDFGPANRQAADIRIFVDGHELATRILYDGTKDNGGSAPLNLGAERTPDAPAFAGSVDAVRVYEGKFGAARIADLFTSEALPYAQRREAAGTASDLERTWL